MSNTKKKNNVRTGGAALTSPAKDIEFINTGHAAQSRYLAALANPFASPAVPIPDSFLTAHVAKAGQELPLSSVTNVYLRFERIADDPTGDYRIRFGWNGGIHNEYVSELGARLVAGGIAFEDVGPADSIQGTVTYTQTNRASTGSGVWETISQTDRMERNKGFGTILYELHRRQALEFEGNASTTLQITFSQPVSIIVRYTGIVETDGEQGFTETRVSNNNFLITNSYPNHHAGVFADTPHPNLDHSLMLPSHTDVGEFNIAHHANAIAGAAHWVASSAGWLWNNHAGVRDLINRGSKYYHAMVNYGGSVMRSGGQIMAIGARAAPLAIGM